MGRKRWSCAAFLVLGCPNDDAPASTTSSGADTEDAETTSADSASTGETTASVDSTGSAPKGWRVIAELGPAHGMAMSVWGTNSADAMVVGGQFTDEASSGFVLRRSGEEWVPDALPGNTPMLHWVGPAGDDVWVVGRDGAALRWEGGAWVPHTSGTRVALWGVWGATAEDVWAVGGDGITDLPTLVHFDGSAWGPAPLPTELPRSAHALFKVWGADGEHVFVVGDGGILLDGAGPDWNATYAESIAPFVAVRGRSAEDVVAVGGRANARVARFDGSQWQDTTLLEPGLNGVWVDASGAATLVGRLGTIYTLAPGSLEPTSVASPTTDLLHAVHGFDDGTRLAVGGTFEGPPPWRGVILEHAD